MSQKDDIVTIEGGASKPLTPASQVPQVVETPHRIAISPDGQPLMHASQHTHHFVGIMLAVILTTGVNVGLFLRYNEYVVKPREAALAVQQEAIVTKSLALEARLLVLTDVLVSKSKTLKTAVNSELSALGFTTTGAVK